MHKGILTAPMAASLLFSLPPHANAAETQPDPNVSSALERNLDCSAPDQAIVTDSAGFTHVVGCETLPALDAATTGPPNGATPAGHRSPYESNTFTCGSSYVRNVHHAYYFHKGTAHASGAYGSGGNCGGKGKVVKASITHKRGGRVLGSAVAHAGQTKTTNVRDSGGKNDPHTQLFHNFVLKWGHR